MRKMMIFLAIVMLAVFLISCSGQVSSDSKPTGIVGEMDHHMDDMDHSTMDSDHMDSMGHTETADDVKVFTMEAKQFEFVPNTIEVNKGDRVKLIVTAKDVAHGISIPEYDINQRLSVGEPVTIEFTADKEGTFTAFCSVACGPGHRNMKGTLIVR